MNSRPFLMAALAALSFLFSSAQAAEFPSNQNSTGISIKPVIGLGLTLGGKKLATVKFDNGSDDKSIKAGEFLLFYGGAEFRLPGHFSVRTTIGHHFDRVDASNGKVSFTRIPIEVTSTYALNENIRLGGGFQLATNGKYSQSTDTQGKGHAKFKSAPGFILKGEYMTSPNLGIEGRYVIQKYEPKSGGEKYSGNHFGVLLTGYF